MTYDVVYCNYPMHYLTLYQYGLPSTKLFIMNKYQAYIASLQDRHKRWLVNMYIVSERFPRREATQLRSPMWNSSLNVPSRVIVVLMRILWDYVPA
jgi:hypothetical protein